MALLAVIGELDDSLGGYVSGGEGELAVLLGLALVVVYLVLIALYAPAAVHAWKLLEKTPLPASGPFEQDWYPRADDDPTLAPPSDGRPPAPPERAVSVLLARRLFSSDLESAVLVMGASRNQGACTAWPPHHGATPSIPRRKGDKGENNRIGLGQPRGFLDALSQSARIPRRPSDNPAEFRIESRRPARR